MSTMNGSRLAQIVLLLLCIGAGAFFLYYGCAMLLVPAFPREPDFLRFRLLYTLLPVTLAVVLFTVAGVAWRAFKKVSMSKAFLSVLGVSVALVMCIFLFLAIGSHFYSR